MPSQSVFHSSPGGFDFLGYRRSATGAVEIVYDDGVRRRMVWRVNGPARDGVLNDVLRRAAAQARVLPALYAELRRRSIAIEAVVH